MTQKLLLTVPESRALENWRKNGKTTTGLSEADRKALRRLKVKCREIMEQHDEAKLLYLELTK